MSCAKIVGTAPPWLASRLERDLHRVERRGERRRRVQRGAGIRQVEVAHDDLAVAGVGRVGRDDGSRPEDGVLLREGDGLVVGRGDLRRERGRPADPVLRGQRHGAGQGGGIGRRAELTTRHRDHRRVDRQRRRMPMKTGNIKPEHDRRDSSPEPGGPANHVTHGAPTFSTSSRFPDGWPPESRRSPLAGGTLGTLTRHRRRHEMMAVFRKNGVGSQLTWV